VLDFIEKDALPGMKKFVKGVMDMGYELADMVVWMAGATAAGAIAIAKSLLDYGITLTDLLAETLKHPEDALENLLKAVEEAGYTILEVFQAVDYTVQSYIDALVTTYYDMEKPVKEIVEAVIEVSFGALDTVVALLLNNLASYRPMTQQEIQTAQLVYQDALDYDRIYFAEEDLTNQIIFGIQDAVRDNPDSRAFVTMNLVNFDPKDDFDNQTMIHELCHVWQAEMEGPFYMAEAIHAQMTDEGYNYGYTNSETGAGAETALQNAGGDLTAFNLEQQAKIMEHFYRRKFEESPALDTTDWEPYVDYVRARPMEDQ
jgi:hypothetical protein